MGLVTRRMPAVGALIAEDVTMTGLDNSAAAIKASPGVVYSVKIDNANNVAATYHKQYDDAAPVVGTTEPDLIVRARAGSAILFVAEQGLNYATAITAANVTAGGTGGITGPTSDVVSQAAVD